MIAFALILGVSLALPNAGIIGSLTSQILRDFCGRAAWAFPPLLVATGIYTFMRRHPQGIRRFSIGMIIIFATFTASVAGNLQGDYFDPKVVANGGGYIGAILSWGLTSLLGDARVVALGAFFAIGTLLCINMPVKSIGGWLKTLRQPKPAKSPTLAVVDGKPLKKAFISEDNPLEEEAPSESKKAPVKWGMDKEKGPTLATDISMPKEGYRLPPLSLLVEPPAKSVRSKVEMQRNIEILEGTLDEFNIDANVVEVATGPTITRYEIQLGPGIRVARITGLADNIAMNLAAGQVRVEAPIPGKAAIGVEVPNKTPTKVFLRELAEDHSFIDNPSRLVVALGKDVSGENKYADLTRMPHLLIGGATNSGKSIGLSTIITSLLMRNTPKDLRLVMIDPKRVELTLFDRIPHLMCPVIRDVKEAPGVLRAVWREMDRRYDLFSEAGVRNIDGWNEKASFNERMSYIVVIIDELADLMMQAAAEVESSICRLAQLARATGIHLVIATQRPSVDVITGTIKANIASRIAFTVSSQIDSRTILDGKGAESLIGRGDMLFLPIDASKPVRIQGCFVSESEIDAVCSFWRDQESPQYTLEPVDVPGDGRNGGDSSGGDEGVDVLWEEAVRWVADRGQASTSMLQRKFSIGFQRASRLVDSLCSPLIVQHGGYRAAYSSVVYLHKKGHISLS